jgi:hypothetical protein
MDTQTTVLTAGAVIGAAGIGAALAFGHRDNPIRAAAETVRNPPGPPSAAWLQRFANSRAYHRVDTQPDNCYAIPIVGRVYTPIVPNPQRLSVLRVRGMTTQVIQTIKTQLVQADRADEDPRCVWILWALESGHGRSIWNLNCGNIKTGPNLQGNPQIITASPPTIWTPLSNPKGVYLLIDGLNSFDGYFSYNALSDYMRDQKRLFEFPLYNRNGTSVLGGYRRGGLDGLMQAAEALSRGGYSGPTVPAPALALSIFQRQRDHRSLWNLYMRAAGGQAAWDALR